MPLVTGKVLNEQNYQIYREKYQDDFQASSGHEALRRLLYNLRQPGFSISCKDLRKLAEYVDMPVYLLGQMLREDAVVDDEGVVRSKDESGADRHRPARRALADYLSIQVDTMEIQDRAQCCACDGQLYFDPGNRPGVQQGIRPVTKLVRRVVCYSLASDPEGKSFPQISEAYLPIIMKMLDTLEPPEKQVILCRFGLSGSPGMSLTYTGRRLGLDADAVKQTERLALDKLRSSPLTMQFFMIIVSYPSPEMLKNQAERRAYVPYAYANTELSEEPFEAICRSVLKMCAPEPAQPTAGAAPDHILTMTIEELDLSVRSFNCLKRAGFNTVGDLTERTENELMEIQNLSKQSVKEILYKLSKMGLSTRSDSDFDVPSAASKEKTP